MMKSGKNARPGIPTAEPSELDPSQIDLVCGGEGTTDPPPPPPPPPDGVQKKHVANIK